MNKTCAHQVILPANAAHALVQFIKSYGAERSKLHQHAFRSSEPKTGTRHCKMVSRKSTLASLTRSTSIPRSRNSPATTDSSPICTLQNKYQSYIYLRLCCCRKPPAHCHSASGAPPLFSDPLSDLFTESSFASLSDFLPEFVRFSKRDPPCLSRRRRFCGKTAWFFRPFSVRLLPFPLHEAF